MAKMLSFEKSMNELEDLVKQLEKGDASLEDCLKQYEKGITLARKCHDALTLAEQKIETLRIQNLPGDVIIDE